MQWLKSEDHFYLVWYWVSYFWLPPRTSHINYSSVFIQTFKKTQQDQLCLLWYKDQKNFLYSFFLLSIHFLLTISQLLDSFHQWHRNILRHMNWSVKSCFCCYNFIVKSAVVFFILEIFTSVIWRTFFDILQQISPTMIPYLVFLHETYFYSKFFF